MKNASKLAVIAAAALAVATPASANIFSNILNWMTTINVNNQRVQNVPSLNDSSFASDTGRERGPNRSDDVES